MLKILKSSEPAKDESGKNITFNYFFFHSVQCDGIIFCEKKQRFLADSEKLFMKTKNLVQDDTSFL